MFFRFFIICKRTNNANNATHYVKLDKKRRESSKRNYYIISPRVIIKAIIIMSPAVAPLSDVLKVVQSLYQLTNSIQTQHSPHLRPFVEGEIQSVCYTDQDDKLQAVLTLKKTKNVEIGLDQILTFFIGNTSSLTDLGQEYKWCPAGNTMGSPWCEITCITKAVSW